MSKRYQVFVSSTFSDLKEERQAVMQTLMAMDCIPAGMELFPAADEEQWDFIQKIIADCDYYVLLLGGRYGSVTWFNIPRSPSLLQIEQTKNVVESFLQGARPTLVVCSA